VIDKGRVNRRKWIKSKPNGVHTVYVTGKSSGAPRLVMINTKCLAAFVTKDVREPDKRRAAIGKMVLINTSNVALLTERLLMWSTMWLAGKYCLNTSSYKNFVTSEDIASDLKASNAILIHAHPYFWNDLYHKVLNDVGNIFFVNG
jgi:hypothetical protein